VKHAIALLLAGCVSSASATTTPDSGMPTAGSPATEDTGTNNGIFGLHDSGTAWEDADGGLMMVVPTDAGADATEPELLDAGLDAAVLPMPDAGHDAGTVPVLGKTCDACTTNVDCAENYACLYVIDDGASACFLRVSSLPVGTYCGDLEPAGHLGTGCYGPCNANPVVCRADTTCTAWKAAYAGTSDY